ncbi:ATP-binding protein, partial [Escherichia coli]|nr:ATP-binding protein [Escherichia coli]
MNTTNGYNLALQRQLVDSKINDISALKQKLEFSKIGS